MEDWGREREGDCVCVCVHVCASTGMDMLGMGEGRVKYHSVQESRISQSVKQAR